MRDRLRKAGDAKMEEALESRSSQRQVSLSSLFWLMVATAFLLAYARTLGASALWMLGY